MIGADTAAPSPDLDIEDFRVAARIYLAGLLSTRTATGTVSVLGAGQDDLAAGRDFLAGLGADGWSVPAWPAGLGGVGLSPERVAVWQEELAGFDVPDLYPYRIGLNMVGPTLLKFGEAEQQRRWLPLIATGAEIWCQLFSEPGAGSDLSGLAATAWRDGDEWVLSGQKVWSSRAHYSDWGLLLARTDPLTEKHAGITCFALPMAAAGVDVRPLRQMNGDVHFNEVFLDDVRVSDGHRIGATGDGWRVARTTLAHERFAAGSGTSVTAAQIVELIRRQGRNNDPVARQWAARTIIQLEVARLASARARALGDFAGPHGSALKLRSVAAAKAAAELAASLLGAELTVTASDWQTLVLTAPSLSIRGGTDEIQRDIVGERVLGLPKEPDPYRGRPWSQIPRELANRTQGEDRT